MKTNYLYRILYISLFFSCILSLSCTYNDVEANTNQLNTKHDSIAFWIEASKSNSYTLDKRKRFLLKSYQATNTLEIDTSEVRNLSKIAYQNFKLGDTLMFKEQNLDALAIAEKLKDSFAIGDIYWNYATYYNKIEVYDSAYYYFDQANRYLEKIRDLEGAGRTQYGMAFIKGRFKDYSGSEVLTFRAISKFEKIEGYRFLHSCYNHLAQLQNDIQEYDRALFYYNKSLEYLEKMEDNERRLKANLASLNNIGVTYLKKGNYSKALSYFDKILNSDSLKLKDINHYARVIDNKAFCKLLMRDTINVYNYLKESLHIRDSLNYKSGIIISKIHLSKYYAFVQDTSKAFIYARDANNLAKKNKNSRDYLESLLLLAKLDVSSSQNYLERHIQVSDSLQIVERKIQNKFIRIAYETDEYIVENRRLSQQKIWIIIASLGLFSILMLLYFVNRQKLVNKTLVLENEQQKANEQVYLITLKQQEKLEKEKVKERNRISEELHDGILGKLFGTRVGLGFLEIQGDTKVKKQHDRFLEELQIIEKEIRQVSHKLNNNFDSSQINFKTIIYQLLESKGKIAGFTFELKFDEHINWEKVSEIIRVNLFRIIQEALQNILKYAHAKHISVIFSIHNDDLVMQIIDDGIGFNVNRKRKGIGIKNMKSRSEKLNGKFHINSKPNQGTTIEIRTPI